MSKLTEHLTITVDDAPDVRGLIVDGENDGDQAW
jgi:hypothetical protein